MFGFFKRRRRNQIQAAPFPKPWRASLEQKFPIYARLNEADRRELERHVLVFLNEKRFEGCAGFIITDEVRVLIAAQACLLLLHRRTDYYPLLKTILVYPHTYIGKTRWREEDEESGRDSRARLGESWCTGAVVLAWSSTLAGAVNIEDGQNVTLHEFAHQLDQEDGAADGAPSLDAKGFFERRGRYLTWAKVLGAEYASLQQASKKGRKTVINKYGATHPAEFFAVATECFFEKPQQLRKNHSELYDELKDFYLQDPVNLPAPSKNISEGAINQT